MRMDKVRMQEGFLMVTVFTVCAIVGSVILVLQLLLMVIGLDHDHADIAEVGDDLEGWCFMA